MYCHNKNIRLWHFFLEDIAFWSSLSNIYIYIYIYISSYYIYISNSMEAYLRSLVLCCLHTTFIQQIKKDFEEIKKTTNTVNRMFTLGSHITLLVCVCVCMYYICVLFCVVVYVVVSMCVYDDTCVTWKIWACLMNKCVVMSSGRERKSRDSWG